MRLLYLFILFNLFFVYCNSFLFQSGYVPIKFKHLNITYKPKYKNLKLLKKINYANYDIINLIKNNNTNDTYDIYDIYDIYTNDTYDIYDDDDDDNNDKMNRFFINVLLMKLFIFMKTRNCNLIYY
uniref:Uncharacterized protein n=1 Tax=viral metagenome TaxID=1070528 RepID=A0A6C0ENX2_9ZZZZ